MGNLLSQEEAVGGREAPCHNFAFPRHSDIERDKRATLSSPVGHPSAALWGRDGSQASGCTENVAIRDRNHPQSQHSFSAIRQAIS